MLARSDPPSRSRFDVTYYTCVRYTLVRAPNSARLGVGTRRSKSEVGRPGCPPQPHGGESSHSGKLVLAALCGVGARWGGRRRRTGWEAGGGGGDRGVHARGSTYTSEVSVRRGCPSCRSFPMPRRPRKNTTMDQFLTKPAGAAADAEQVESCSPQEQAAGLRSG
eukprot:COSAG06_NODE_20926_length_776_cov_0.991137_2_plen_165_part_00